MGDTSMPRCDGPVQGHGDVVNAFFREAKLMNLTAMLPRCGVEDIAPLLDRTHELGEWTCNAFPRDLPLARR
jgi:hypothetical protein